MTTLPTTHPAFPAASDPLGETLHLLQLAGTLYCRAELTAPWGIDLPPMEGCMMFHIVTAGACWLEVEGAEPRWVRQGSLVLVPHGAGHRMRNAPEAECIPLFDIPVERLSERYEVMRHGGGGDYCQTICVVVSFDHAAAQQLINLLPGVLQIDSWDDDESWLQSTLRFISREAKELRPGGETVITRLADILAIQLIRKWIDTADEPELGWIAALRDEHLGKALRAIHREPARDWTVEGLAEEACMSRSAFSARFTQWVGQSAMQYVTQWRMQLACTELRQTSDTIATIADRLGYQSEVSFNRAFKRLFGVTPGSARRQKQKL